MSREVVMNHPVPAARFPVDLHVHSTFSDGTLSPHDLVAWARRCGLRRFALTDHDTTAGLAQARAAAAESGVEVIAGIELSAWHSKEGHGKEIHILGYFVDPDSPELQAVTERQRTARQQRAEQIGTRLAALGCPIDVDAIIAEVGGGNVGRPHIARALIDAGHVSSFDEAFSRFLAANGAAYVPASRLSATHAISLVHRAGGLAVLAHPGVEGIDDAIPELVRAGLDGIEADHPAHDASTAARYRRMAERLGVIATGGSDFHEARPGHGLGTFGIAADTYEALRARRAGRAND